MSYWAKISLLFISSLAFADTIRFTDGNASQLTTTALTSRDLFAPLEVELKVPLIDVQEAVDGFHSIRVQGLYPAANYGAPEVLQTGVLLAVPEGYQVTATLIDRQFQELANTVVEPAQRKYRCHQEKDGFAFQANLYESNEVFPANVYNLEDVGKLGDLRLVRIALNPTQMNFKNKTLDVTTALKVRVDFVKVGEFKPVKMAKSLFDVAKAAVANAASLPNMVNEEAGGDFMLVMVADAYKNAIAPFVEWKRAKGIKVQVTTLTEAGGTKEKVKAFVQNVYDKSNPKLSYLLMVGNKTSMPPYMEPTSSGSAASDLKFALVSGTDWVPDIFFGRLVADNETELNAQMTRWIQYEKDAQAESWYPQATTIASSDTQGGHPYDNEYAQMILDDLQKNTYKKGDLFWQGNQTATPTNISSSIRDGRTWLTYIGHGSGTGWGSTNGSFSNSNVAQLTNSDKLLFLTDVACDNASWVNISKCFGKAWVTHTYNGKNAGAVAYYGGSVSISWHEPAVMSTGIAKYHFEKSLHSVGATVVAGQLYLVEKMGTGSNVQDNFEWYNLFSDPSLTLRTATPKNYDVKLQVKKGSFGRPTVEVQALAGGQPIPGLLTSLSRDASEPLATAKTNDQGKATLTLPQALEPNTKLTVTGYNYLTVQKPVN